MKSLVIISILFMSISSLANSIDWDSSSVIMLGVSKIKINKDDGDLIGDGEISVLAIGENLAYNTSIFHSLRDDGKYVMLNHREIGTGEEVLLDGIDGEASFISNLKNSVILSVEDRDNPDYSSLKFNQVLASFNLNLEDLYDGQTISDGNVEMTLTFGLVKKCQASLLDKYQKEITKVIDLSIEKYSDKYVIRSEWHNFIGKVDSEREGIDIAAQAKHTDNFVFITYDGRISIYGQSGNLSCE